jgi:hypothetical protein
VQAARVGYLLKGNMAFGIHKDFLIVRMTPSVEYEAPGNGKISCCLILVLV